MGMDLGATTFLRLFSVTMRKNKKFLLGEMSFFKDFVHDEQGDLYPLLRSEGSFTESINGGNYTFSAMTPESKAVRLLCRYFPYASYELDVVELSGECGISFKTPSAVVDILFRIEDGKVVSRCGGQELFSDITFSKGISLTVSCRCENFDIYVGDPHDKKYVGTFCVPEFHDAAHRKVFLNTVAAVYVSGNVGLCRASSYMDSGISQADIRPIRYENGEVMIENGKIYLTMSVRMEQGSYQGVFSWIPGTCDFELTGAIFFDAGDGVWANDIASSILYHRTEKRWYIWVCSFSHGHILGHAIADGEIRFGLNLVDITLMEKMAPDDPDTSFLGKEGDEDPDFVYDEVTEKWRMMICRHVKTGQSNAYRYFYFESDKPFSGYKHITNATSGSETGGSIIRDKTDFFFVCGNDFRVRAEYRCYRLPNMEDFSLLKCDYDDGGFRGWGSIIPIKKGTRTQYYWLTFDRHNGSTYNWSYGNIYCFLAEA